MKLKGAQELGLELKASFCLPNLPWFPQGKQRVGLLFVGMIVRAAGSLLYLFISFANET